MTKKQRTLIQITAIVLIVAAIASGIIITACIRRGEQDDDGTTAPATTVKPKAFPFSTLEIAKFCSLPENAWKNLTVSVEESQYVITDEDVEEYIHNLQKRYIADCPTVHRITDRAAADGDTVYIRYAGYVDGLPFKGGCNIVDKSSYALTLGSGAFIDGFEDALIGVVPTETSMTRRASGDPVEEGDIVYFSYAVTYLDDDRFDPAASDDDIDFSEGEVTQYNWAPRIDLSTADRYYGDGFSAHFTGKKMTDDKLTFVMRGDFDGDGKTEAKRYVGRIYLATKEVTKSVTVTFPDPYRSDPDLAGKEAVFEVVIDYIGEEEYPELTSEFITDTLNFSSKTGDPVSEFRTWVRTSLAEQAKDARKEAVEGEIMNRLLEQLTVTAFPEGSVEYYADAVYDEAKQEYEYYRSIYGDNFPYDSAEKYFIYRYGLAENEDISAWLRTYGEKMVKENLLLFCIAHAESMTVTEEDKQNYAKELADRINASNGSSVTAEQVIDYYGDEYLTGCANYKKVMEMIYAQTTVTDKEKADA